MVVSIAIRKQPQCDQCYVVSITVSVLRYNHRPFGWTCPKGTPVIVDIRSTPIYVPFATPYSSTTVSRDAGTSNAALEVEAAFGVELRMAKRAIRASKKSRRYGSSVPTTPALVLLAR